jgi:hypothetical protein
MLWVLARGGRLGQETRPARPAEDDAMVELIVVLIALALFEVAAWRWGVDSTDGIESREWLRRRDWPGFGRGAR